MEQLGRSMKIGCLALLSVLGAGLAAGSARAQDPWAAGSNWLSVRAGYALSKVEGSGHGGGGYGFGFSHQLSRVKIYRWTLFKRFSLGGYVHYELLSRFGHASEIEMPVTVELVRHFRWGESLRPYLGIGGGSFYRKTIHTGSDLKTTEPGAYLTFGMNTPISNRHLLGLDMRVIRVDAKNDPPNPIFGPGSESGSHLSFKLNYSLAY